MEICGSSPNCVCSLDPRSKFNIEAINLGSEKASPKEQILKYAESRKGFRLIGTGASSLRFACKTKIGGFEDLLELDWGHEKGKLHLRSESQKGYWDFGANRRRLNRFLKWWKMNVPNG